MNKYGLDPKKMTEEERQLVEDVTDSAEHWRETGSGGFSIEDLGFPGCVMLIIMSILMLGGLWALLQYVIHHFS